VVSVLVLMPEVGQALDAKQPSMTSTPHASANLGASAIEAAVAPTVCNA
jgi:hypothetical protein